jgi:hypothetical protein
VQLHIWPWHGVHHREYSPHVKPGITKRADCIFLAARRVSPE